MDLTRRGFLKAMGAGAGAIAGTRLLGSGWVGSAAAATPEPTAVVVVYLDGGINAIFTGADAFLDTAFGVTASNVTALGGVVIDNTLASAIPQALRGNVASVGIRHGISDHEGAQRSLFMSDDRSAPLVLASAIGGSGAIKAAVVGDSTGSAVNGFASRMAAAELMVRSGTSFVIAQDVGWDTHGDTDGNVVRNRMSQRIAPALWTFLSRMVEGGAVERNVVVAILGDFHRSLPGSDHQASLAALVIGKRVRNATTGRTDARVGLGPSTPGIPGLWQLLAAAARTDTAPFGANPHPVLTS